MTVLADETLLGRVLTNLVSNVASHHVASVEVEDESGRRSPAQAASLALSIWADTYERGRRR